MDSVRERELEFVDVHLEPAHSRDPVFVGASFIPQRALMLFQARARFSDGREFDVLAAPAPGEAAKALDGGPQDFMGNASFSFGAALLVPYANRIRGDYSADSGTIETLISGRRLRLPANGGGKDPGAEKYAIHGLILARSAEEVQVESGNTIAHVSGRIRAGDFGVHWPSATDIRIRWVLRHKALSVHLTAQNVGNEDLPIGVGWHPYFALPSGMRQQARLHLPARSRIVVNNYDDVLPTGEVSAVTGTRFDFRAAGGAALGYQYLDDCFVDLEKTSSGETVCIIIDPAAGYGLKMRSSSPEISAIQTFTRPDRPFVVVEPQFNWADPYGPEWGPDRRTGMVVLQPMQKVEYAVILEMFTP
jgi:galactose mutarotase-like enzyme